MKEFKLPDLGEGLFEAEIAEIPINAGDQVEEGTIVLLVETDKASVEIPSPYNGRISEILVSIGDLVEVGDPLIRFSLDGDTTEQPTGKKMSGSETAEDGTQVPKPDEETPASKPSGSQQILAAPSTRQLARQLNVALGDIKGSGPAGRVTAADVRNFAESLDVEVNKPAPPKRDQKIVSQGELPSVSLYTKEELEMPDFAVWGDIERIPLRSIRRAVAKRMTMSWSQIPHVTHQDSVDITELENLRQRLKGEITNGNLTLTIFVIKALVAALKDHPNFNTSLDLAREEIILKNYYNIGIAVDTDRGLIVPVIQNANQKNIVELSQELTALVQKTREDKNSIADLQGGTFTITNAGAFGATGFSPIINYPQVAILGLAQARWQPVVQKDPLGRMVIEPRYMLPLILTFDHRVLDGGDAGRFMNTLTSLLKDPQKLLLKI